jgi:hypothetical protein
VSNGRDDIDTWLEQEVTPLLPAQGTLDRIRRTARRRKTTQAVVAAAGCAVIIGAAVAVPQVLASLHHSSSGPASLAAPGQTHSSAPPISASASPPSQSISSTPVPGLTHTYLSTTTSGGPVPVDFRPTSVTFVGADNGSGGEVGAVIGQAGPPCANASYCTSLAGTSDYGSSWYGVSAPPAPGPTSPDGVSQLRFSNLSDGWAFGPGLWETSKGGWPWTPENTHGMQVTDLETVGGRAFAIFASCSGTGQDYASTCTSFSLYTSTAGSTTWTPVSVPAGFATMKASTPSAATLVISGGSTGYLLTPSGAVLSGPVTGGAWTKVATAAPCAPGTVQADGQPNGAQLSAGPSLLLACESASTSTIYTSRSGATWQLAGKVQVSGNVTALGGSTPDIVVLATTAGSIYYSDNTGASWHAASVTAAPLGGFSYVGMTTSSFGVAVPADAQLGEVFVTSDGGQTWKPSDISG